MDIPRTTTNSHTWLSLLFWALYFENVPDHLWPSCLSLNLIVDKPELFKVALKSLHGRSVEPFLLSFLILPPGIWCPMDPSIIGPWSCLKFEPAFFVYWRKIYPESQIL
jgi:hypothetical protein